VDFESVVAAIDPRQTGMYNLEQVTQVLQAAKWLLLIFLLCEAAALVLSLLLRFWLEPANPATAYNNFDEVRPADRASRAMSHCCQHSGKVAEHHRQTAPADSTGQQRVVSCTGVL
jgi:hypothetical protein